MKRRKFKIFSKQKTCKKKTDKLGRITGKIKLDVAMEIT